MHKTIKINMKNEVHNENNNKTPFIPLNENETSLTAF